MIFLAFSPLWGFFGQKCPIILPQKGVGEKKIKIWHFGKKCWNPKVEGVFYFLKFFFLKKQKLFFVFLDYAGRFRSFPPLSPKIQRAFFKQVGFSLFLVVLKIF